MFNCNKLNCCYYIHYFLSGGCIESSLKAFCHNDNSIFTHDCVFFWFQIVFLSDRYAINMHPYKYNVKLRYLFSFLHKNWSSLSKYTKFISLFDVIQYKTEHESRLLISLLTLLMTTTKYFVNIKADIILKEIYSKHCRTDLNLIWECELDKLAQDKYNNKYFIFTAISENSPQRN